MRDSKLRSRRLAIPLAAAFAVTAIGASAAVAQDEPAFAGLDKDLSGVNLKMAVISGIQYDGMYAWLDKFEEETGATVEHRLPGRRLRDRPVPEAELRRRHGRLRRGLEPHQLHGAVHELRGAAEGLLH